MTILHYDDYGEPIYGPEKAYVYRSGEFLGCLVPTGEDFRISGNWRNACIRAAIRVWGDGIYHVTSAPYEEDR